MIYGILIGTFLISFIFTLILTNPHSPLSIIDHPNERSLHSIPTPRTGGIAIMLSILISGALAYRDYITERFPYEIILAALFIAVISYLDDRFIIKPQYRLAVHIFAAILIVGSGMVPDSLIFPGGEIVWPLWMAVAFTVLLIVWMINLYNFMDGMDGFAGGMAVFGFGAFSVAGITWDHIPFAFVNLIIVVSTLGFLFFNFPPAKIFLGDVGSTLFGMLSAYMALWASQQGIMALWLAGLIFSPFLVDATVTLIRRALNGDRVWQPHKTHYYQRLVQMGWSHRRTVLWEYALMAGCGISALAILNAQEWIQLYVLAGWCILYTALMLFIGSVERRRG